jgi:hypothetical protein
MTPNSPRQILLLPCLLSIILNFIHHIHERILIHGEFWFLNGRVNEIGHNPGHNFSRQHIGRQITGNLIINLHRNGINKPIGPHLPTRFQPIQDHSNNGLRINLLTIEYFQSAFRNLYFLVFEKED